MKEDKHIEALREVKETIDEALKDPRGLIFRQRRLMAMMSLGAQHLVEVYFHRLKVLKPGAIIKHNWLAFEERRIKLTVGPLLTKPPSEIPGFARVLYLAREVESGRNDIVYGAPLPDDSRLKEKINSLLELKKAVEENGGKVEWG